MEINMKSRAKNLDEIKIAYIGGGSKQWARVFMTDLALAGDMSGEIGLYDIDREAAVRNQKIGERINNAAETVSKWNYVVYDRIEDALENADFVVISILPGTFEQMRSDVHAPEKYGIYQSVGDTAGPGGVLRAMRTVPVYEMFARKIREVCPDAWVINFTNPMSICVKTLYDVFPEIKAFGCCHEVFHTQDFLCDVLKEEMGIEATRNEIYTDVSGINHFTWIKSAKYHDVEIMDYMDDYVSRFYECGHYEHGTANQYKTDTFAYANRVKMDMYKRYGVLGAAGDRHLAEFMNNNWYLASKEQVDYWKFALTTVDFRIKQMNERIQESIDLADGKIPVKVEKSQEEAVDIMRAILGLKSKVTNVNLPNRGQVKYLPLGSVVETNAVFTNDSVVPVTAGELPAGVVNLISRCCINVDDLYNGIKNRNHDMIFNAFMNQPLCSTLTLDDGLKLFDEMTYNTWECLKDYYPQDFLKA
ncbi:MAG: alpha-glucosidase/alpha-galactosidase [Clostridia bacterium]|nr:alpha-glucosidase/alpha-galactosidase [Clostridia bacterium]